MNTRTATQADVEAISLLYTEFFAYNASQQPKTCAAVIEGGMYPSSVIDSDSGAIIMAEHDGKIVGFVHMEEAATPPYPSVIPHRYACIVDFIVTETYRKKGIGHLLLEEAKHWTKARGLEYIELMVLENNDIGKSFYERENFATASRTMRLEI